ncbi:MAG: hypothetical protein EPN84_00545, partial [Legionella sp.]
PKPDNANASGHDKKARMGYFETKGARPTQEDALTYEQFDQKQFTPKDSNQPLSPVEIGHRLWTSFKILNRNIPKAGTTAATTVYDGKGNLVTATLADSVTFAAVYDKKGHCIGVSRLNSVTHKPTDPNELARIQAAGGFVAGGRVQGQLAVSRAMGDHSVRGVCAEATIDITSTSQIVQNLGIDPKRVGSIQIITTCDGFTDGAGNDQSKKGHEQYLFNKLRTIPGAGTKSEQQLANYLAKQAIKDGSQDNVSIAVQTINAKTPRFLLGLYDGHGGKEASTFVARHIAPMFEAQCAMSRQVYAQQELAVNNRQEQFYRDNPKNGLTSPLTTSTTPVIPKEEKVSFLGRMVQSVRQILSPKSEVTEPKPQVAEAEARAKLSESARNKPAAPLPPGVRPASPLPPSVSSPQQQTASNWVADRGKAAQQTSGFNQFKVDQQTTNPLTRLLPNPASVTTDFRQQVTGQRQEQQAAKEKGAEKDHYTSLPMKPN